MNIRNVCKLYKQNGRKSVLIFSHSYSCIYGNICLIIRLYVLIFVCLILLFFFLFSQRYEIKQEKSRIWLLLNCSLLYLFCPQHKKWYLLIFLLIINKNKELCYMIVSIRNGSSSNLVVISFLFQLSSSFLILLKVVDMFAF